MCGCWWTAGGVGVIEGAVCGVVSDVGGGVEVFASVWAEVVVGGGVCDGGVCGVADGGGVVGAGDGVDALVCGGCGGVDDAVSAHADGVACREMSVFVVAVVVVVGCW